MDSATSLSGLFVNTLVFLANNANIMKTAVIIPSRYHSQRLPQKPLAMLRGMSLVERVFRRVEQASGIDSIHIATDHEEIAHHVKKFGGKVIMTSPECPSGTDRVAEAAKHLPSDYSVVINVQGDEPLLQPEVVTRVAEVMRDNYDVEIATPISPLLHAEDLANPAVVKVVLASNNDALYFSRQAIPFVRDEPVGDGWISRYQFQKHIGVYAYRREVLDKFVALGESSLEYTERLEQLRLLEAGYRIRCVPVQYDAVAVDTPEDVVRVEAILDRTENG